MDFESEEYKIRNQSLFYNNEVRFKNKPLLIKKWIKGGIRFLCQTDADGECMEKH